MQKEWLGESKHSGLCTREGYPHALSGKQPKTGQNDHVEGSEYLWFNSRTLWDPHAWVGIGELMLPGH